MRLRRFDGNDAEVITARDWCDPYLYANFIVLYFATFDLLIQGDIYETRVLLRLSKACAVSPNW